VNGSATLRELSVGDAPALLEQLADPIALRHVAPCPATITEIRRFARWARETRGRGRLICFAVIPAGYRRPVGLMQLWPLDQDRTTAEWGVVIGRAFWGSGLFPAAASLLLQFAFDSLGVARLQARTAVGNDRAGAAMQKIGGATVEERLSAGVRTERATPDVHRWSFSPSSVHIAASIACSKSTLPAAIRSEQLQGRHQNPPELKCDVSNMSI